VKKKKSGDKSVPGSAITLKQIQKAVKTLTESQNQQGHNWIVHPAHAKELSKLGYNFVTGSFAEHEPVEKGKDYTIPAPEFAHQELDEKRAKAAEAAGVSSMGLPHLAVKYYDKAFVANLKAHSPFILSSKPVALPKPSGTPYKLFTYGGKK
jgi:hypothetical protein